ncbi:MAG: hypothetical protein WCU88_05315 [Elusimicrobiota bacterium]|jgi:hypothetical protein
MKAISAAILFLFQAGAISSAQALPAPATKSESSGESVFVGQYGEVLSYPAEWNLRAGIADDGVEVLQFFPKNGPEVSNEEFQVESNFASKRLMDILVIPKRSGKKFETLAMQRRSEERDLKKKGVEYTLIDEQDWPTLGAFRVNTTKPYQLMELYSQSDRNIFIMGIAPIPGDIAYTSAAQAVLDSLKRHEARSKKFLVKQDMFAFFKDGFMWSLEGILCGICLLLLLFRKPRARWCAAAIFAYAHVAGLYAWATAVTFWLLGKPLWMQVPAVPLVILAPLISWAISKKMGGTRLWRVVVWAIPPAIFFGVFITAWARFGSVARSIERNGLLDTVVFHAQCLFVIGILFGFCFGLTHETDAPKAVGQQGGA